MSNFASTSLRKRGLSRSFTDDGKVIIGATGFEANRIDDTFVKASIAAGIGTIAINNNATLQSGGAAITLGNGVVTTGNGLVDARAGEVLTLNGSVGGPG